MYYSSGCGCSIERIAAFYSNYSAAQNHSPLERTAYAAQVYVIDFVDNPANVSNFNYSKPIDYKKASYNHNLQQSITITHIHNPWLFLKPNRPVSRFIGDAFEIKDFVEEAFKLTTDGDLPEDISIHLCSREELIMLHSCFGGFWKEGILGFAINNTRGIFVMKNNLDVLMPTIGHELGHVLTSMLKNQINEEAKAFAFEIAFIKKIHEHNVANLREAINMEILSPANNGLHDVAFDFVKSLLLKEEKEAIDIYWEIAAGFWAPGQGASPFSKAKGFEP